MTPTNLRDQIIRDEGCRLKVYTDTVGVPTIGVGRNLKDKGISQQEADLMLDNDLSEYSAAVLINFPWAMGLTEVRRAVLTNMAFNLGIKGLKKFKKMLAAAENGDYEKAAEEMLDSDWATQVGDRAVRLANQMASGEWH